jgi:transposase
MKLLPESGSTGWSFPFTEQDWDQTPPAVQAYLHTLHHELGQLHECIEGLEARLKQDSTTSSKPPSSDSPYKKPRRRTGSSPRTRKGGGKPGHTGHRQVLLAPTSVEDEFRKTVVGKLESEKDKLTPLSQEMFWKLVEEFAALEEQLAFYQEKLESLAKTHPECQRLMTIPGIGPLSATALVAAVSDASAFHDGRQFAAWLGLVPRQHSTGGKERLLGISKRGDRYLRKLLIHGARATMRWVSLKTDRRSQWIRQLVERRGKNRTAVAIANKNARIVWALLTSHQSYQPAKS